GAHQGHAFPNSVPNRVSGCGAVRLLLRHTNYQRGCHQARPHHKCHTVEIYHRRIHASIKCYAPCGLTNSAYEIPSYLIHTTISPMAAAKMAAVVIHPRIFMARPFTHFPMM